MAYFNDIKHFVRLILVPEETSKTIWNIITFFETENTEAQIDYMAQITPHPGDELLAREKWGEDEGKRA